MESGRVCIIGAGAAGIAAAYALSRAGVDFDWFEAGSRPGGLWRYGNDSGLSAAYSSLITNTSAPNMRLFGYVAPSLGNGYLRHDQALSYLEAFLCDSGLGGRIAAATRVTQVEPKETRGYRVTALAPLGGPFARDYGAVLVANGRNWARRIPAVRGSFSGHAFHAFEYQTPGIFSGRRVVIAGFGNTGADIAVDAAAEARQTILSTRGGGYLSSRYAHGSPSDQSHNAWAHRLPRALRWELARMRLRRRGLPPKVTAALEKNAQFRAKPRVINDRLPELIDADIVQVRPGICELNGKSIAFSDGSSFEADILVWATGYRTCYPFFSPVLLEQNENFTSRYLRVIAPRQPGLYFLGHASVDGPVFPVLEQQAQWVAELITGKCRLPDWETLQRKAGRESAQARKLWPAANRPEDTIESYAYVAALRSERSRQMGRGLSILQRGLSTFR